MGSNDLINLKTIINSKEDRFAVLDSFRFLAILVVMLFHYFSRYSTSANGTVIYPYATKYDYFTYGYLGVQFFFIISGFVIAYTLHSTENFAAFWKKRVVRLLPPMIICSMITFVICLIMDTGNIFPAGKATANVLLSTCFVSPQLVNTIFGTHLAYLNGSYWSLWTEIQFYLLASAVYFLNPKKFILNFSFLSLAIYGLYMSMLYMRGENFFHFKLSNGSMAGYDLWYSSIFDISSTIMWFLIGILFYKFFTKNYDRITLLLFVCAVLFQFYGCRVWPVQIGMLFMLTLFSLFIVFPTALGFLKNKLIASIGLASYSLYLIHENIGVLLIHKWAAAFGSFDFLFPMLMALVLILFSLVSYKFIERPLIHFFRNTMPKSGSI